MSKQCPVSGVNEPSLTIYVAKSPCCILFPCLARMRVTYVSLEETRALLDGSDSLVAFMVEKVPVVYSLICVFRAYLVCLC